MRTAGAMRYSLHVRLDSRLLIALIAALWPVWQWLAMRARSDSADAWALLSLVTACAVLWREGRWVPHDNVASSSGAPGANVSSMASVKAVGWSLPAVLMLVYTASYPFVPPIVRAMFAISALAAVCSSLWFGKRMNLPLWGLSLLALPLVPSMNFYLGYPLRVVVGEATSVLLQLNGFAVVRDGATLLWGEQQISIDAPCSGIKMLWTGLYLSCALAALMRLGASRTILLASLSMVVVMSANVLRAAALFYVEAGVVPQAQPAHGVVGVFVFAIAAMSIVVIAARVRGPMHAS
jgi:exosortase/archaeosortase family protein